MFSTTKGSERSRHPRMCVWTLGCTCRARERCASGSASRSKTTRSASLAGVRSRVADSLAREQGSCRRAPSRWRCALCDAPGYQLKYFGAVNNIGLSAMPIGGGNFCSHQNTRHHKHAQGTTMPYAARTATQTLIRSPYVQTPLGSSEEKNNPRHLGI